MAHHEGRVVFVRYALPGEKVRVRVTADRGSYWHAEVIEVIEPSADRTASLCPIAGPDGAGCCDLAFAVPEAARVLKAKVVANQLAAARRTPLVWPRHGGRTAIGCRPHRLADPGSAGRRARPSSRLSPLPQRRAGDRPALRRSCQTECWTGWTKPTGRRRAQLHVAVDDDGQRHVVRTVRRGPAQPRPQWWRVPIRRCSGWAGEAGGCR